MTSVPKPTPKQKKPRARLRPRSQSPARQQRYEDSQRGMQEHRAAVRWCEGPSYGLVTPCGVGIEGVLQQHHVISRGMGGGRDYGLLATLCARHHSEIDRDRETARRVGLSIRPPVPSKVVTRWSA